jgi:hypothetical protein
MPVGFEHIHFGRSYDRPELARLWGYSSFQAFSRGVFTPKNSNLIILFVTREKQKCLTQYRDFLSDDLLFWEGEDSHANDYRVAKASEHGDEIHLFYRSIHHAAFIYYGRIILTHYRHRENSPSEFVFKVVQLEASSGMYAEKGDSLSGSHLVAESVDVDNVAYAMAASEACLNSMDRRIISKTRGLGQRLFRGGLLKLCEGECAITGVHNPDVLVASHIKPWTLSAQSEKLDPFNGLLLTPNFDALFDSGLVSFEDSGRIIISPALDFGDREKLRVHPDLALRKAPPSSTCQYLEFHRDTVLRTG